MLIKEWEERADVIYNRYIRYLYELEMEYQIDDKPFDTSPQCLMEYTFAHIVWADYNFESYHVQWSLDEGEADTMDIRCKRLVSRSLKELLLLPKYEGCEDYGDE